MAGYIFGEYKDKEFMFKRTATGWKGSSGDVKFLENAVLPKEFSANEVKGKLFEKLAADVTFYKAPLNEALTMTKVKELLQTKLGCLSDNSNADVEELFSEDGETLDKTAIEELEAIASGKVKERHLNTTYLKKAWITVRGANQKIRKLDSKQGAYLFAYMNNGDLIEGISGSGVLKYHVDLKDLKAEEIHKRFEDAKASIETDGLVNNFSVVGPKQEKGEAIIITLDKKTASTKISELQSTFREVFTAPPKDTSKDNKLVKLIRKAVAGLKDLFNPKNGKTVDLLGYKIQGATDVQMYYSQEEVDLAKNILARVGKTAKKDEKPAKYEPASDTGKKPEDKATADKTSIDKQPTADKPADKPARKPAEKPAKKPADKPATKKEPADAASKDKRFDDTSLGRRLRRSVYKKDGQEATNPEGLKNAREAGKNIRQAWNQKDAETLLRASADAINNSAWKDPKALGDTLRQTGLIEKEGAFELTDQDKATVKRIVDDLKKAGYDADTGVTEAIDDELALYVDECMNLEEIEDSEVNAFTSALMSYAMELLEGSKELNEDEDDFVSWEDMEDADDSTYIDLFNQALENCGVWSEPSIQGGMGSDFFFSLETDEQVGSVDWEVECEIMNGLVEQHMSEEIDDASFIAAVEDFVNSNLD